MRGVCTNFLRWAVALDAPNVCRRNAHAARGTVLGSPMKGVCYSKRAVASPHAV